MEDIAPELYKKIVAYFNAAVKSDSTIKTITAKLNKRPLTHNELTTISTRLGNHASAALKKTLVIENLPDGKLYWNIADRTIRPVMEQVYSLSNSVQMLSQRVADQAAGVNIGISKGIDPDNRIREIIDFATNSKTAEELDNALNLPVKTTALDFNDDFMRANADIRNGMGFIQTVVREYDGVGLANGKRPCNWCIGRAGTWTYEEAKENGVFERHVGCGCTIDVISSDKVSNEEYESTVDLPF